MPLLDYEDEIVSGKASPARREAPQSRRTPRPLRFVWFLGRLAAGLAVFGLLSVIVLYLAGSAIIVGN